MASWSATTPRSYRSCGRSALRVNPQDRGRIGVDDGERGARDVGARRELERAVAVADRRRACPPASPVLDFSADELGRARELDRRDAAVTDLRVETLAVSRPMIAVALALDPLLSRRHRSRGRAHRRRQDRGRRSCSLLVSVMLYIWFMRKVIADMQNRIGPNRAGPYGVLQTLADGIKLFFKEQSIPDTRRPAGVPARAVPLGPAGVPGVLASSRSAATVSILGHQTYLQLADPPIGVLFLLDDVGHRRSTA